MWASLSQMPANTRSSTRSPSESRVSFRLNTAPLYTPSSRRLAAMKSSQTVPRSPKWAIRGGCSICLSSRKRRKTSRSRTHWAISVSVSLSRSGFVVLEGAGQFHAIFVQVFARNSSSTGLYAPAKKPALSGLAAGLGQLGRPFLQRPAGHRFVGKQPVDLRELLAVGVVRVVELRHRPVQSRLQIGLVAAVDDVELLEIGQPHSGVPLFHRSG